MSAAGPKPNDPAPTKGDSASSQVLTQAPIEALTPPASLPSWRLNDPSRGAVTRVALASSDASDGKIDPVQVRIILYEFWDEAEAKWAFALNSQALLNSGFTLSGLTRASPGGYWTCLFQHSGLSLSIWKQLKASVEGRTCRRDNPSYLHTSLYMGE